MMADKVDRRKAKYRPRGFYQHIGSLGGKAPHVKPRGFAAMSREKRIEAARKGGSRTFDDYRGKKDGRELEAAA